MDVEAGTSYHTIKWPWVLATYVWNVDRKEFADLYGRMHGYDPKTDNFVLWDTDTIPTRYGETGRWLAKQWAIKETDPLVWLSSLSAAQVDRIQTKIEETVYAART
jgi:hypothetical protein|tara:strand:- start:1191 stop:1508 length:318 start_codon:yes stop_codon:yes gene_type:complete